MLIKLDIPRREGIFAENNIIFSKFSNSAVLGKNKVLV